MMVKGYKMFVAKKRAGTLPTATPPTKSDGHTAANSAPKKGPQKFGKPGKPKMVGTGRPIKKSTSKSKGLC